MIYQPDASIPESLKERQTIADQNFAPHLSAVVRNGVSLPVEYVREMERAGVPLPADWRSDAQ